MSTQAATPRADLHTHTALCKHASGTPEEYLAAAQNAGLAYWGVSDHFPAPAGYDAEFRMAQDDLPPPLLVTTVVYLCGTGACVTCTLM